LQPPFFGPKLPSYLNYGAIGTVVGHEVSHAFDNNGRRFDSKGRLIDWWSNSTAVEFEKRSVCFVDQYSKFSIKDPQGKDIYVNGKLTLGENLADNGGIRQSWRAWKAGKQNNPRLPGLPLLIPEQLFFLQFAYPWCGKAKPEYLTNSIRTDPHSPGFARVNGVAQNSAEFAQAFRCPAGSKMNPPKKCLLW
jgi:endothelin-converting enzyme